MKQIEEKVYNLVKPYAESNNLEIYDVIYEKRGKDMYLSIYIDSNNGVSIEDCEKLTNYINPILDEEIELKQQYFLEVSSSGLEKVIRTDEHFEKFLNSKVRISLFKAVDSKKEYEGILKCHNSNSVTLEIDDKEYCFDKTNISLVKTVYDWNI